MRLVFFLQGERVPAARIRGMAIAHALERHGIECSLRPCRPSVYGDTSLPYPLNRVRPLFVPFVAIPRLLQMRGLRDDDVVVIQRPLLELPVVFLERMLARRHRTIFDFDDAIFLNWRGRKKLAAIGGMVDRIVAGNRFLAEQIGFSDKTTVIPTVVDTARWRFHPAREVPAREVVVGWTGTRGNYRHLEIAKQPIVGALRRTGARFLVIADAPPPPSLAELGAEFVPWREGSEIEDLARIDVGVMPLPDEPRERGKCAFKLIQYMAIGRPGVASPVGANNDVVDSGVNGYLAADERAWEDALVRLIEDSVLRREMGQRARARIEAAYSLTAVIPKYLHLVQELSSAA
jgi:glycosyltransferase involved in cell wall biosynthesis